MKKSLLKIAAIVTPVAAVMLAFSYPEFVTRFYGSLSLAAALLICAAAINIPGYRDSNDQIRARSIVKSVINSLVGAGVS